MLATTIILVVAIVAFCTNRLPPALVALCVVIALYLTGSVDLQGALSGFADPVFVYLAGLFVVAEALELTGLTAWAGQQLTRTVGDRRSWVLVALMLLSAALTALVSTNAAVATAPKDLGAHAETLAHAHSLAPGETALSYAEGPPRS